MSKVTIYKPTKVATQSSRASHCWIMEFPKLGTQEIEPIMGWTSTNDPNQQITLEFETLEQAQQYAQKHGLATEVILPQERKIKPKSYGSNFLDD